MDAAAAMVPGERAISLDRPPVKTKCRLARDRALGTMAGAPMTCPIGDVVPFEGRVAGGKQRSVASPITFNDAAKLIIEANHVSSQSGRSAVSIELLYPDAKAPARATHGSAGYDLCAYVQARAIRCSDGARTWDTAANAEHGETWFLLEAQVTALIPLGFRARLPIGIEAQIRPRSGLAFKKGLQIPNAPGTIDPDYPEEWMVIVRNPTAHLIRIEHGERIAQMVLARYETLPIELGTVGVTTSRVGGFGSTGN